LRRGNDLFGGRGFATTAAQQKACHSTHTQRNSHRMVRVLADRFIRRLGSGDRLLLRRLQSDFGPAYGRLQLLANGHNLFIRSVCRGEQSLGVLRVTRSFADRLNRHIFSHNNFLIEGLSTCFSFSLARAEGPIHQNPSKIAIIDFYQTKTALQNAIQMHFTKIFSNRT
jgi:hypothetical protein